MKSAPIPTASSSRRLFAVLVALPFASLSALATTYIWDAGGGGTTTWSTGANWNPDGAPTLFAGDIINLGSLNIAAGTTSTMDAAQTIGGLILGDTDNTHSWTLAVNAALTLDGNGSAATINQTSTSKGDTINGTGAIGLASDLIITNSANTNGLTIANAISAASAGTKTITNSGTGTGAVTLSGAITAGSGSIALVQNSATSSLNITNRSNPSLASVTIKNGTFVFNPLVGTDSNYDLTAPITLGDATLNANVGLTFGYRAGTTSAGTINVLGTGTHTISGTHTNTGQISILNGAITLNNNDLVFSVTGASGFRISGGITGTGNITINNTNASGNGVDFRTVAVNNTGTITNISSGVGGVSQGTAVSFGANVTGLIQNSTTSLWTVNQANGNFVGTAQVLAGTMAVTNTGGFNVNNTISVASGAIFDIRDVNLTIAGLNNVSGNGGSVSQTTSTAVRTLTLGGSGTYSFSGVIAPTTTANFALTKSGTGTQTLSGNNTYDGLTTISGGTLKIGHVNALGSTVGATTLSGGTLDLNGFTIGETVNVTAASTLANSSASAAALSVDANLTNNLTVNTTGDITATRLIGTGAPRTVTKLGAGTLTTNGTSHNNLTAWDIQAGTVVFANTSGYGADRGVTLNGGTLRLSGSNSDLVNNGQTFVVNSGVFDLNGKSEAVASVGGTGGFIRNGLVSTTSTLFVGGGISGTSTDTYAGVIENGSGTLAVTKEGSGSQTFTGANTFTGGATVSAGTLATGATGTFGAGNVSVAAAAALTFGNNSSIIDTATLTFASTSTINLNFTGAEVVGSVFNSVTSTALAAGTYDAAGLNAYFGGISAFTGTGSLTVSAVPEPSTFAAIAGLGVLGLAALRRRHR